MLVMAGTAIPHAQPVHAQAAPAVRLGVYLIDGGEESIYLSDQPRSAADRLLIATKGEVGEPSGAPTDRLVPVNEAIERAVQGAARANAIDPQLLRAVIATESAFSVRAVSRSGAMGLMQLMPETARRYGVTEPFDVSQNVGAGAQHLRHLLDRFDQNLELALAAYNAGSEAVTRYGRRVPPYAETQAYVPRVLQRLSALCGGRAAHTIAPARTAVPLSLSL
jgi:soluble lytic murein transglycosylase-like protein